MNNFLRNLSLLKGLEPPESKLFCGCGCNHGKSIDERDVELLLASRPHKWKEIRQLQAAALLEFGELITKYETQILKALNLPDIDTVRESVMSEQENEADPWEWEIGYSDKLRNILSEWQFQVIGTRNFQSFKQLENNDFEEDGEKTVLPFYLLEFFAAGVPLYKRSFRRSLPDGINPDIIDAIEIIANRNNPYFRKIQTDALTRVSSQFKDEWFDATIKELQIMANNGYNPLKVAKQLHNKIGEGNLWYWNRLTRTESTLALNGVYDEMATQANVLYDEWIAHAGACQICQAFAGNVWKRGEGPYPAASTHPHCTCERKERWVLDGKPVRERWTRPSPYDVPYEPARDEAGRIIRDSNGYPMIPELQNIFG